MKRHLRLFLLYFAQCAKVRFAYKAGFFSDRISSKTATVVGFAFVLVLFSKTPIQKYWREPAIKNEKTFRKRLKRSQRTGSALACCPKSGLPANPASA
jgi:hypothetical protein